MRTNSIILFTITSAELIIIVLLCFVLYQKYHKRTIVVSGGEVVNPIKKESINFPSNSEFRYFYELRSHTQPIINNPLLTADYTINEDGLNERFDYSVEKPEKTFRIISLGDSWTFGAGIDTGDNYTELLENMLNKSLSCKQWHKYEVINLGLYGYDLAYSVEKFNLIGKKYDPDLIIWHIKDNNFLYAPEFIHGMVEDYIKNQNPFMEQIDWNKAPVSVWKSAYSKLVNEKRDELFEFEQSSLSKMNDLYTKKIVFFLYSLSNEELKIIDRYAKSRNNTYIFDRKKLLESDETIPNDGHPNKNGHMKFAEELFHFISSQNIIPCN